MRSALKPKAGSGFHATEVRMRSMMMKKLSAVLLALALSAVAAHADSLVTTQPTGTDSVVWSQLGPAGTSIPNPFSFTTTDGVTGAGSYANTGGTGSVAEQGYDWGGNFYPAEILNWTDYSGALTLDFAEGYAQIGAQIDSDDYGDFTAQICDVNGCFTEDGDATGANNGSAIYIGIEATSPIDWVTFSLTSAPSDSVDDFAIGTVTLVNAPLATTPEPGSLLLLGTGLLALLGLVMRRQMAAA